MARRRYIDCCPRRVADGNVAGRSHCRPPAPAAHLPAATGTEPDVRLFFPDPGAPASRRRSPPLDTSRCGDGRPAGSAIPRGPRRRRSPPASDPARGDRCPGAGRTGCDADLVAVGRRVARERTRPPRRLLRAAVDRHCGRAGPRVTAADERAATAGVVHTRRRAAGTAAVVAPASIVRATDLINRNWSDHSIAVSCPLQISPFLLLWSHVTCLPPFAAGC